jgi:ABC-type transport system involved in multi-copper enzyme maturation permease subunit
MNPAAEVGLVAARELRKNLRSAKGIVLLVLSVVGGAATAYLMARYFQTKLSGVSADELRLEQEALFTQATGDPAMGKLMATAPLPLVMTLNLCIWLTPLLIALAGFDAISGELQHRTVRYWTVRTRRGSYFVGKFVGVWASVSAITLSMHVLMWSVSLGGAYSFGATVGWGFVFWLVSLPISAAWCGIATLVGSFFRSPPLSLLTTFATFFVVWLVGFAISRAADVHWLSYVYPNNYDAWLLSPHAEKVGGALGICFGIAALTTAAGGAVFARRDV